VYKGRKWMRSSPANVDGSTLPPPKIERKKLSAIGGSVSKLGIISKERASRFSEFAAKASRSFTITSSTAALGLVGVGGTRPKEMLSLAGTSRLLWAGVMGDDSNDDLSKTSLRRGLAAEVVLRPAVAVFRDAVANTDRFSVAGAVFVRSV
jgi:hypothetical protein